MEFRYSRLKSLGLLALVPVMVGASLFTAVRTSNLFLQVVGWFGAVFFSLGLFPAIKGLVSDEIVLVINDVGIEDRRLKTGMIPWPEIDDIFVAKVQSTAFLCLTLHRPGMFPPQLSGLKRLTHKANRGMGFGDISIAFVGLKPPLSAALEHLSTINKPARQGA